MIGYSLDRDRYWLREYGYTWEEWLVLPDDDRELARRRRLEPVCLTYAHFRSEQED